MDNFSHIHFIGIGGIGMSALARLMHHEGKEVSGTNDIESPQTLDALRSAGVAISLDTSPDALPEADCYVYSDAWPDNFPEVVAAARASGRPTYFYAEALGMVANRYYLIAVAGAHGKTTTTAMLTDVLEAAGLEPTAVIGSLRSKTKSNFRAGTSKYFVVEADEYRRHFLAFEPDVLVITNVEADHLDYYRDIRDVEEAFAELARRVPEDGAIVCNPKGPHLAEVLKGASARIVDYTKFFDPQLTLRIPGVHNLANAAAALAVGEVLGIENDTARSALADFAGTWRRSEHIGTTAGGALVYDDYAHHPTEVETTLRAFRERYPDKRLVVAFQPHLHSRTKAFFEEFARALALADEVVLAPIYEARKEQDHGVSSELLASRIGAQARAFASYDEIAAYLADAGEGDLILTMGAAAINTVAEKLCATT